MWLADVKMESGEWSAAQAADYIAGKMPKRTSNCLGAAPAPARVEKREERKEEGKK